MMTDADGRIAFPAEAARLIRVGRRRAGDGIEFLLALPALLRRRLLVHELVVLIPGHLATTHPEWPNRQRMARSLDRRVSFLVIGTAAPVGAAGNGEHAKLHLRAGNRLDVALVPDRLWRRHRSGL